MVNSYANNAPRSRLQVDPPLYSDVITSVAPFPNSFIAISRTTGVPEHSMTLSKP